MKNLAVLTALTAVIESRKQNRRDGHSYVAALMSAGEDAVLKKVIEEAGEVLLAAKDHDAQHLVRESADLLFHLMVLLSYRDLDLDTVLQELANRQGQSGLAEKAARGKKEN